MDAIMAVELEVDKVSSKLIDIGEGFNDVFQELIDHLEGLKTDLETNNSDRDLQSSLARVKTVLNKSKVETQKLAIEHRELHSTVSKVGKAIDKNFVSEFSATCKEDIFANSENNGLLNQIICQHFYREGMFDIAEEFLDESETFVLDCMKDPYVRMKFIKEALQKKNIFPALEWAKEYRSTLESKTYPPHHLIKKIASTSNLSFRIPYNIKRYKFTSGIIKPRPKAKKIKRLELVKKILQQFYKCSSLEFKLHQLAFLMIIQKGVLHQTEAVKYARANFSRFIERYEKEIQTMMGMLLFVPQGIDQSPYSSIIQENMWEEVNELFIRDACTVYGFSSDSLLNISIGAGCVALPALLNFKNVMEQGNVDSVWKVKNELPIDIDLDLEHRFHSMFACPILRQQTSETNPPMRLVCGHIISKDALQKLGTSNKLKCPYCPKEQSSSEAKQIFF